MAKVPNRIENRRKEVKIKEKEFQSEIKVGCDVYVPSKETHGTVKYVGKPFDFGSDLYVGVELVS